MLEGRSKYRSLDPEGSRPGCQRRYRRQCADLVGTRPVERELGLENLGVRVRLRALADGGSRIVHPQPDANGEFWNRAQCVGEG